MHSVRVAILLREIRTGRVAPNIIHSLEAWFNVGQYVAPAGRGRIEDDAIIGLAEILLASHPKHPTIAMMLVTDALRIAEQYTKCELEELTTGIQEIYDQVINA